MENLSLAQAISISDAAQFIVGMPLDRQHPDTASISCVTVCPHQQRLKEQFVTDYQHFGTTDLTEYLDEDSFDVVAIARSAVEDKGYICVDLGRVMDTLPVRLVA